MAQFLVLFSIVTFVYLLALSALDAAGFVSLLEWAIFDTSLAGDPLSWHRAFWSMAIHLEPLHLIGNILVLFFIGVALEERIGTARFAAIYVVSGFVATLAFALMHVGDRALVIGASGAIFGLMGALLVLYPKDNIAMFLGPIFLQRVPVYIAVGAMILLETLFVALSVSDGVAHIAHVGGFVAGASLAPLLMRAARAGGGRGFDYRALEPLAATPELAELLEKARREEIPDVARAWLSSFAERASCTRCGGGLALGAREIKCEKCGKRY